MIFNRKQIIDMLIDGNFCESNPKSELRIIRSELNNQLTDEMVERRLSFHLIRKGFYTNDGNIQKELDNQF